VESESQPNIKTNKDGLRTVLMAFYIPPEGSEPDAAPEVKNL
jgi:hypothetical protein